MATRKTPIVNDDEIYNISYEPSAKSTKDETSLSSNTSTKNDFEPQSTNALPKAPKSTHTADDKTNPSLTGEDANNYEKDILALVENLRRDNYLPVIFIGARGTGKTEILTSLIKFFRSADDSRNPNSVNVTFGKPLVTLTSAYGRNQREFSEKQFREFVDNALKGDAAGSTVIYHPLAIPVRLSATIDGNIIEQNFAFFEAAGEWFEVKSKESNREYYPQLRPEIIRIFKSFDEGMGVAVIYTAPCDVSTQESETLENQIYLERLFVADQALQVGLTRYMETRIRKDKDKHIFLLTKWDAVNKVQGFADKLDLMALDPHSALSLSPDDSMKYANLVANKLYPGSYGLFKSTALVASQHQRIFMPYSAGMFSGKYVARTNDSAKFDRYIKSIWNELMFAAGHTKPLFSAPPAVNIPWWKKFLNIFG